MIMNICTILEQANNNHLILIIATLVLLVMYNRWAIIKIENL